MATVSTKWYQTSLERFMDKVAIVSVSTYRDRYLDELRKNAPPTRKRPEQNGQLEGVSQKYTKKDNKSEIQFTGTTLCNEEDKPAHF